MSATCTRSDPNTAVHARQRWLALIGIAVFIAGCSGVGAADAASSVDKSGCVTKGTTAAMADAYFGSQHGNYQGADYQRSFALPDGRVLWTLQDAMFSGTLVHNVGVLQSSNCFTVLGGSSSPNRSWLMGKQTRGNSQWYWALGGEVSADGTALQLLVEQMNERGRTYLSHTIPTATLLVTIRLTDMAVIGSSSAPADTSEVWGFSVTSDRSYTYLYSYCYRQFGFSALGADPCENDVKVGRVDKGHLEQKPTYWNGSAWQGDPTKASIVFGPTTSGHGINPPQVRFTGTRFTMISQADDWFSTPSTATNIYAADSAQGPWTLTRRSPTPFRCEPTRCDTYFASWLADGSGWGISHNVWSGPQGALYLPTFHASPEWTDRLHAH